MNSMKIKKGDTVRVIAGKDRFQVVGGKEIGVKEARVLRTVPAKQRVVVEGANKVTKAVKPTQANPQGGLSSIEAPLHVSNVMLVCPNCKKATRVGARKNAAGKKVRVCKKCGKDID